MRKVFIAVLVFMVVSLKSNAQTEDVWTLERCIQYALENNIEIKRQELQTVLNEKDYLQEKYNLLPSLGAGIEHQLSSGRSLNIENYEWENRRIQQGSAGVRGDVTLFKGLQNLNSIQRGRLLFLSAGSDLETIKNEKTLLLAAYYLDVLFSEELLEVAKSQYEVTLLQEERSKKMVEVGNAARSELLEIQAQVASEKLKVTEAKNQLDISILNLTQLLDLDSVGNFRVYKPDLELEMLETPGEFTNIYAQAVHSMPEIQSAEYMLQAQEKAVEIARGERSPELYLSGLYYSRYLKDAQNPLDPLVTYPLGDQLKDNQYAQVTIGLSIPIFTKFQTQTNISKSKVMLQDYRYMVDLEKQKLYKKIQQYHADATAAHDKYLSALEAVKSNVEAFNYTRQKFEVGLVNSVDFNIARTNLSKAQSDLAQAKYEYIFKMKMLDFYQGNPISL